MTVIVMNHRDYKNFTEGNYYHVFNRGNEKQLIFKDEEDFSVFYFFMQEAFCPNETFAKRKSKKQLRRKLLPAEAFNLKVYCLMPNHYHFLVRQNSTVSISKLIAKICTSYSKYFNKKYKRVGHLFQDRFKAVLIESDSQFNWTIEYIINNPKEGGLVTNTCDYKWSSQVTPLKP